MIQKARNKMENMKIANGTKYTVDLYFMNINEAFRITIPFLIESLKHARKHRKSSKVTEAAISDPQAF